MCESFIDASKHNADSLLELLYSNQKWREKRAMVKHVATIESASELSALP